MSAKVVATLPGAVKKIESEGGLVHSGRALFLFARNRQFFYSYIGGDGEVPFI